MRIAVLSGKGGAGKTFVSVNLAAALEDSSYIDCDVEEPNGHLFFKPENRKETKVKVKIPKVDHDKCDGSRVCVDFCKFNALGFVNDKVIVFEEQCHFCNGCITLCPQGAITTEEKPVGKIVSGQSGDTRVHTGILNIGEASATPVIDDLLKEASRYESKNTIVDCPPGSACSVMDSIQGSDYCILVAEPTIFGLHNLKMIHELVEIFNLPYGIVINKSLPGSNIIEEYCQENDIDLLLNIPYDEEIDRLNSKGLILSRYHDKYKNKFLELYQTIEEVLADEAIIDS